MNRSSIVATVVVRVLCLGTAVGTVAALTPSLIAGQHYVFLAIAWAVVAAVLAVYATSRAVPAKYLAPGSLLLILFVVVPVLSTLQLSTTNYGDGTRGTKDQTIERILANSVVQAPESQQFNLTVATTGSPATGPFTFFLVDQETGTLYTGTEAGLQTTTTEVTMKDDLVTAATGYTILTSQQVNAAAKQLKNFTVPTDDGAIRQRGLHEAYEGVRALEYDEASDTITNTASGVQYTVAAQGDREYFVDAQGERISDQSWRAGVGLDNYHRAFTDDRILSGFLKIFAWNVFFAVASVALTFLVGLGLAVTLNDARVRGQKLYRSILLLPYAIPGFISILVWSSFYNQDFGLINDLTGLNVNWLGNAVAAKAAVLLTNLWLGFPYMFLVCTGALQSIPSDLKEAASIDGAGGFGIFRRITFPLLLVSVSPLLVASFAFNFNNFNVIQLLTEGGPFSPGNPDAGGTDILISYTVRLAFGANGAQLGFAAAIATLLFVITAVMAAGQYRVTRRFEEVN